MLVSQYAGGYEGQLKRLLQQLQEKQVSDRRADCAAPAATRAHDPPAIPMQLAGQATPGSRKSSQLGLQILDPRLEGWCCPFALQDVLELLQGCQRRWLQLLPALAAPEVAAQSPEVAERHRAASAALRSLLEGAAAASTPQEALQALVQPAGQRLVQLQACQAALSKVGGALRGEG
jgi:hypothetical protein